MRVKICGITRPDDARAAEAAGADAIGLIFAERSDRYLTLERATEIVSSVGPFISRVGVFVDAPFDQVLKAARILKLDAVQLHGGEELAYISAMHAHVKVIRALSFSLDLTPQKLSEVAADAVLVDGADPGKGRTFDWSQAAFLRGFPRLILAGGLTPENVDGGVWAMRPCAVDVSSGVELVPGVKDHNKVRRFIENARAAAATSAPP